MKILYASAGRQCGKARMMSEFVDAMEAAGHTVIRQPNGAPRYCDEHDHRYEAGAYGVCRRCGGEWRSATQTFEHGRRS